MKIDREQTEEERRLERSRFSYRNVSCSWRNKRDRIRNATSIRYFARYNIDTRTHTLVTDVHTPRVCVCVCVYRWEGTRGRDLSSGLSRYVNDADIIQVRYMEARILAWTSASR